MRKFLLSLALMVPVVVVPLATAGATSTTTVPVVVCPTSLGVNSPQTPVASSARVPASATGLVVYSATSGYIQILGPRNLACQAEIGADGDGEITVAPANSPNQAIGRGGVGAVADPTCLGCLLTLACPFFPAALAAARHYQYGCTAPPFGQVTHRVSADAVLFSDPAGEYVSPRSEGLVPSDSPYPTKGVVVYDTYTYKGYHDSTAMEAVCVLPANEQDICTVVLDEFLATQVRKFT
jgi:hypothetical protein